MNATDMNNIHSRVRQLKPTANRCVPLLWLCQMIITLLMTGCDDRIDLPGIDGQEGVPEGMVRVTINPTIEQHATVVTRTDASDADKVIGDNTYILVATTNTPAGVLVQKPVQAKYTATNLLKATLYEQSSECYLWVVANVSETEKTYLSTLVDAGTTISTIADVLKHRLPTSPANTIASPLPMYGVSSATKLTKSGGTTHLLSGIPIPLSRSVARIDVDGSALSVNFKVHSMQIVNGAPYGFTLPQTILPTFGETEVSEYMKIDNTAAAPSNTTMTDLVFCYENSGNTDGADDRATRVVICGTPSISTSPSYYPIDIIYPNPKDTTKTLADIERNKLYKITLKRVDKDGYKSYEEAARSEAFNKQLDMDITVSDPYAHDITTNGKQYLGITNSEFVLYPRYEADVNNIHIATYTYTSDLGWDAGAITFEGDAGLSIASGSTTRMDASPFPITRDLLINIGAKFESGTVVLHIGNLRKEIKVRRKPVTSPTGGVYEDYFVSPTNAFTDYKVGEIITPSAATSWIKVSANNSSGAGESSLNDKVTHPEGGIYIHTEANAGYNGSTADREAMLYVAGERDDQRIKVMVQQSTFDVYSQALQIKPYAYVGTFHRWNETGERLIRIKAEYEDKDGNKYDGSSVYWQADVVAGREFIVLDLEETKDNIKIFNGPGKTNVNWNGQGDNPNYKTSAAVETSPGGQLNSKLRTVSGTGNSIYFRVGLTGKLSGPEAQPRYGLITISYRSISDNKLLGIHNIYVRQGEAADYLMRPWDPSTTHPKGWFEYKYSSRPKARKFAPYNLTDPQRGSGIVDRGKNGYVFVDYPSQGGYYMAASQTKAISPNSTFSLAASSGVFSDAVETCPRGYRRPADGKDRMYKDMFSDNSASTIVGRDDYPYNGYNTPAYGDDIENSEMRQSIWLFPLHSGFRSDFTNQLRGFLADGYFDRREVTLTNVSPAFDDNNQRYGIVSPQTIDAAYWGFLVFNPHNYASIFVPLAGYNTSTGTAGYAQQGKTGDLLTRTLMGTTAEKSGFYWMMQCGYFKFGSNNGNGLSVDNWVFDVYKMSDAANGSTIRCIKDEQEIISSQPGDKGGPVTIAPIDPADPSQLAIRHLYKTTDARSLQAQIEAEYNTPDIRKRINSIAISGDKALTTDDYAYLNAWADKSNSINGVDYSGSILHHLIIRGKGNLVIPADAFTSPQWSNIMLIDATTIEKDAFASGVTGMLRNLTLKYLDAITVEDGAFRFSTTTVQLHLDRTGYEYTKNTSGSPKTVWTNNGATYTWQAIKGE